jgi:predicted AlkP superfamily pyrophosphatase or phosphodiesterase
MLRRFNLILVYTACVVSWTATPAWAQLSRIKKPKLIVTLVVDQFRADQVARFQNRLLPPIGPQGEPGGLRYLTERGAYYPLAEFGLLQNMTCPGHATILSGAHPYQHGISGNIWYDASIQKSMYCVEDPGNPQVGVKDPGSQRGVSPKNFRGTTLGDELKNSGYRSRVVTVALKDRAAVLLGGARADLALWFDRESQNWVSSRYYLPDGKLPAWVQDVNTAFHKNHKDTLTWNRPEGVGSGTSWTENTFVEKSKATEVMGRDFPHQVSGRHTYASYFPESTTWTVDTAIAALQSMKLGRGADTDLLGVSFSTHDNLSHSFGPNSRQVEELTIIEDREIARLLKVIKQSVGLENTIIVLTGDHGGMPNAEWLHAQKLDAGRVDEDKLMEEGESFLVKTFGSVKGGNWIAYQANFNFYLNPEALKQYGKLNKDDVASRLARFFREETSTRYGILHVFSAADVRMNTLPPGIFHRQIQNTFTPGRSGDVVMILKPNYVMPGSTAEHLSGYTYDRMVPLALVGPQIKAGVYGQKAEIIDIAPTLAFFAGTLPPTGSEGRVLHEILRNEIKP